MNTFMIYSEIVNTMKYIEYSGIHWNTMGKKDSEYNEIHGIQWDTLNYNEKKILNIIKYIKTQHDTLKIHWNILTENQVAQPQTPSSLFKNKPKFPANPSSSNGGRTRTLLKLESCIEDDDVTPLFHSKPH